MAKNVCRRPTVCTTCGGPSWSGRRCRVCVRGGYVLTMAERRAIWAWRWGDPFPWPPGTEPDAYCDAELTDMHPVVHGRRRGSPAPTVVEGEPAPGQEAPGQEAPRG